jgi:hypothetical protein
MQFSSTFQPLQRRFCRQIPELVSKFSLHLHTFFKKHMLWTFDDSCLAFIWWVCAPQMTDLLAPCNMDTAVFSCISAYWGKPTLYELFQIGLLSYSWLQWSCLIRVTLPTDTHTASKTVRANFKNRQNVIVERVGYNSLKLQCSALRQVALLSSSVRRCPDWRLVFGEFHFSGTLS